MNQLERIMLENQILIMQVLKEMTTTSIEKQRKLEENIRMSQQTIKMMS